MVAIHEFHLAWPNRDFCSGNALIDDLTCVLDEAVNVWSNQSITQLHPEYVSEQIASCIISHKFVLSHRRESARRDVGFYGNG